MIETWMIVNDLISDKGDKKNEEVCLSGCYHDDKSATVNKLGTFFQNIGPEVQASVYDKYQETQGSNLVTKEVNLWKEF